MYMHFQIVVGKWIARAVDEFSKLVLDKELDCEMLSPWDTNGVQAINIFLLQ